MERLFFSAPEHDAAKCSVCHRKKRRGSSARTERAETPQWLKETRLDDLGPRQPQDGTTRGTHAVDGVENGTQAGPQRSPAPGESGDDVDAQRLPPQTVLARVLRELEDDFAHYRQYAPYIHNLLTC